MLVTEAPSQQQFGGFIPTGSSAHSAAAMRHPAIQPAAMQHMRVFYPPTSSFAGQQLHSSASTGSLPSMPMRLSAPAHSTASASFLPGAVAPAASSLSGQAQVSRMPITTSLHNPPSLMQLRMMQRAPPVEQAVSTQLQHAITGIPSSSNSMFVSSQHFYPVDPFVPLRCKRRRRRRRCRKTTRNRQFTEMNLHLLSIADIGEDEEEDDSNDNDDDLTNDDHEDATDDSNDSQEEELSTWWAEFAAAQLLPEGNQSCDQVEKLQATIRRGLKYHEQASGFFTPHSAERTDSEASKDNRWSLRSEDSFAINLDQLLGSDDE